MLSNIRVHVRTEEEKPNVLHVWMTSNTVATDAGLPPAVQDDLRLARARFFCGGHSLATEDSRVRLQAQLQNIVDRHYALGNLDYVNGVGFTRMRDAKHVLEH